LFGRPGDSNHRFTGRYDSELDVPDRGRQSPVQAQAGAAHCVLRLIAVGAVLILLLWLFYSPK
jgi:hypothetical protein